MTKDELVQNIGSKIAVAHANVGIAYVLGSQAWVATFNTYVGPGEISIRSGCNDHVFTIQNPKRLIARYRDPQVVNDDALNIMRLGVKDAITQSFEMIRDYCDDTNQVPLLRAQPWYHFTRVVRNSMSHNYTLSFRMPNGAVLPDQSLQFSDRRIELRNAMEGHELDFDILPFKYALELAAMMRDCARSTLT